ncbi:hypothetical protein [Flavobacterium sp.]|uniref:hypothetical protein n=1 Tax=Flavobacterium sp. TaxID=239 RepID=UPI00374D5ADA
MSRTNRHRWENESETKYSHFVLVNQSNLYNDIEESHKIKNDLEIIFELLQIYHEIIR